MDEGRWDNLKSAFSNGSPGGENCEYEPAFLELMSLASPRPEVQMGKTIIAARLHDWPAILQQSVRLSERTRDLRVGVLMAESLAQLNDWDGLAEGFEIVCAWTTQLWLDIFPELDQAENQDPTARLSALSHLLSDQFISRTLYQLPLAVHTTLGTLRVRDTITIHKGKNEVTRELSSAELEAFFKESEALPLAMRLRNLDRCCLAIESIEQFVGAQPGAEGWSALRALEILHRCRDLLSKYLTHHQFAQTQTEILMVEALPATANGRVHDAGAGHPIANAAINEANGAGRTSMATLADSTTAEKADAAVPRKQNTGVYSVLESPNLEAPTGPWQIRSRNEVTTAIDAICDYFRIHEPGSPVPLLLQRAKRLTSMNFIELMHELAPNEALQLLRQLHVVDKAG